MRSYAPRSQRTLAVVPLRVLVENLSSFANSPLGVRTLLANRRFESTTVFAVRLLLTVTYQYKFDSCGG